MSRRTLFLAALLAVLSSAAAQSISPARRGYKKSRVLSSNSDNPAAVATTTSKYRYIARHRERQSVDLLRLPKAKLLVVVLAGGSRNVYHAQRGFWRMIRPQVAHLGVEIYLTGKSTEVTKPTVSASGDTVIFPGEDNYYPAPLGGTVQCAEYIIGNELRGHDADYFLRTNMSTFWAFINLLSWIGGKPRLRFAAAVPYQLEIRYPGGTGILMSMDVVRLLLQKKSTLRCDLIDDVAFGHFFISEGIHFDSMERNNSLSANHTVIPFQHNLSEFNWRVKNEAFEEDRIIFEDEK